MSITAYCNSFICIRILYTLKAVVVLVFISMSPTTSFTSVSISIANRCFFKLDLNWTFFSWFFPLPLWWQNIHLFRNAKNKRRCNYPNIYTQNIFYLYLDIYTHSIVEYSSNSQTKDIFFVLILQFTTHCWRHHDTEWHFDKILQGNNCWSATSKFDKYYVDVWSIFENLFARVVCDETTLRMRRRLSGGVKLSSEYFRKENKKINLHIYALSLAAH